MNTTKENSQISTLQKGLLTIGIPVFEEEKGLAQTLSSIANLKEFLSGEIEVVVWDNDSDDLSYKVASDFAAGFPELVFVGQNVTNLGMRENLRQVIRNSKSKFVWILGAGEQITLPSLAPLMNYLGDPRNVSLAMGTIEAQHYLNTETSDGCNWEIQTFAPNSHSCFVETISLSIVSSNLALEVVNAEDYGHKDLFHLWPHLEMALIATSDKTFRVVSPKLVRVSANPTGWWYHGKNALGIYLNQVKLLKAHPRKIGWIQDRLKDRTGWHFAKFAFEIKLEGAGLKPLELLEARSVGIQGEPFLAALAIAFSPKTLLRIVQGVFRLLKSKK